MSFSSEIRLSLLGKPGKNKCCRRAFGAGLLSAGASLDRNALRILVGDAASAKAISDLLPELYSGDPPEIQEIQTFLYRITLTSPSAVSYIKTLDADPAMPPFTAKCKDCRCAYMRGLFAGSGRVSDPDHGYHLEFSCAGRRERMLGIAELLGLPLRYTRRNREELLYTKNSADIQDFFGLIGENDAYFRLMNSRIEHEIRNGANRITNCEANNIVKAVNAAAEQITAIEYLAGANLLGSLPQELAATAELRLANRDLSLAQLAALSVPPISKPGLSHRLKRLVELADEHRKKNGTERKEDGK